MIFLFLFPYIFLTKGTIFYGIRVIDLRQIANLFMNVAFDALGTLARSESMRFSEKLNRFGEQSSQPSSFPVSTFQPMNHKLTNEYYHYWRV